MPTFRIREAAELLGVSYDTMRRWAEAGRIEQITDESGRLAVDGAALARFAEERAESGGHPDDGMVTTQSLRNRFAGLVTRVVRDTVMAQVEIQAGPHRFVSLLSREAADELGLEPGMLAVAAVKSTNVSVEIPRSRLLSAARTEPRSQNVADILGPPSRLSARDRARRAARGGGNPRSVPVPLLVPAVIAVAFLVLPLAGLVVRAPWGRLGPVLAGSDATAALWLSLWTATVSTGVSLVIGVPLAWVLARTSFPGRRLLRALVTLPLVLPPVVGGVALLLAFGRAGLVGRYLDDWFGLTIPFSPLAVVMAETFVAMPFLVITVEGALRSADQGFEEAAATLGATRMTVFRRVTVPLIAPSLGAGAVLCWARALGEFGATITFAGSFPGRTETMPIAVYYALEDDPDAAFALSLVLLLVSVVVLVSLRDRWLRGGAVQ